MKYHKILQLLIAFSVLVFSACSAEKKDEQDQTDGVSALEEEAPGVGETNIAEAEEADDRLLPNEEFDEIVHGVRVIISYNAETNTFEGTIENISEVIISNVRVEVHLSNDVELGPTEPIDLDLGDVRKVSLDASGQEFERWTVRAESER